MVVVMNGSTSDIACMVNSSVRCSQACCVTSSNKQNGSSSKKRRRDGSKKGCIAGCSFSKDTNCEWELEWSETFKEPVAAIYARRDIEVGEELKYWYRYDFEHEQKMITGETAQPLKKKTYQLPENTTISDYFTFRFPNWECNKCGKKTKPQKGEFKQSLVQCIEADLVCPRFAQPRNVSNTRKDPHLDLIITH